MIDIRDIAEKAGMRCDVADSYPPKYCYYASPEQLGAFASIVLAQAAAAVTRITPVQITYGGEPWKTYTLKEKT